MGRRSLRYAKWGVHMDRQSRIDVLPATWRRVGLTGAAGTEQHVFGPFVPGDIVRRVVLSCATTGAVAYGATRVVGLVGFVFTGRPAATSAAFIMGRPLQDQFLGPQFVPNYEMIENVTVTGDGTALFHARIEADIPWLIEFDEERWLGLRLGNGLDTTWTGHLGIEMERPR